MKHQVWVVLLAGIVSGCGSEDWTSSEPPEQPWFLPQCSTASTWHITFTTDEGLTRVPRAGVAGDAIPVSFAALENRGGVLLMSDRNQVWRSLDAGCTWSKTDDLAAGFWQLSVGNAEPVYAWYQSSSVLYRISPRGTAVPVQLTFAPQGLGVNPGDPRHVRAMKYGRPAWLMESLDHGGTWTEIGSSLPQPLFLGRATGECCYDDSPSRDAEFDPQDLDHAIVPYGSAGAFVTFDGGATWTQATGFDGAYNFGNDVAFGPDGLTVWMVATELNPPAHGVESLFLSRDGGLTFARVVSDSASINVREGLLAHPANTDVVYLFDPDPYGTELMRLFRYDAGSGVLSLNAWPITDGDVRAAIFNPVDPALLYLALMRYTRPDS